MTWDEYSETENLDIDEIRAIVNDFENCDAHGGCDHCKCYGTLNSTHCNLCELLLTYRDDIIYRITEVLDKM